MTNPEDVITKTFGNKLRVRVCGICIKQDKVLMIKHQYLASGYLWAPPGGGMEFGQDAEENLKREFLEETGLLIEVENFLFINEFLATPLHGIELFFKIKPLSNNLICGKDPEISDKNQILKEVKYMNFEEIKNEPPSNVHGIFKICDNISDLLKKTGYFKL